MGGDWRDMERTLEVGDLSLGRREPTSGVQVSQEQSRGSSHKWQRDEPARIPEVLSDQSASEVSS
jgi:hypothetical protein